MTLLIASLLVNPRLLPFYVQTLNFELFLFFFLGGGGGLALEITLPDVKIKQRKRGDVFDLHETPLLTCLKNPEFNFTEFLFPSVSLVFP